jgi:hypothetical protein
MYKIINTKENWIVAFAETSKEAAERILSFYEADKRMNCYEPGIYKIIKN